MELVKTKFSMDCFDHNIEGMTYGYTWNGWACPYFTFENAVLIGKLAPNFGLQYDAENDKFINDLYPKDSEYYEQEEWECKIIDGVKYYPIGSHAWCWYEMNDEDA